MTVSRISNCFKLNEFFWKIFGLWSGRGHSKFYNYYSILYVFVTLIIYNILLTLNLIYTPRIIELLIREVIFYFTEVAVTGKVLMVLCKRKKILETFDLLDCNIFKGKDEVSKQIIDVSSKKYIMVFKAYAVFSNCAYSFQVILPLLLNPILGKMLELPICKYYFLSDDARSNYFTLWFIYQSFGMYGHMMYNVTIDSFIAGLIFMCITQLKVIQHKMENLKLESTECAQRSDVQEKLMLLKLNDCLKHYDLVLELYYRIQDLISITMFVQFGIAAAIICVVLSGVTLSSSTQMVVFLITYLLVMISQIFVPGWLGTELSHENQQLVFAAYSSDWIPRTEQFKRSLRLFVERANSPMVLMGMKMFPLALGTFTSIMKTAYSFFTLLRNVQDREN